MKRVFRAFSSRSCLSAAVPVASRTIRPERAEFLPPPAKAKRQMVSASGVRCIALCETGTGLLLKEVSQKFSITQALLLYVETVKARFLPSGEASGAARMEVVVHNSETPPFRRT